MVVDGLPLPTYQQGAEKLQDFRPIVSQTPKLIRALYPNMKPYTIAVVVVSLVFLIGVPAFGRGYFDASVLPYTVMMPLIFVFPFVVLAPVLRHGTVRIFEDGIWIYHYQEFYAFEDVRRILYRPHEDFAREGRVLLLLKDPLKYDVYDSKHRLRPHSPVARARGVELDPYRIGLEFAGNEAQWGSTEELIALLEELTGLKAEEHDRPYYRMH